jgi:hypothetical protein
MARPSISVEHQSFSYAGTGILAYRAEVRVYQQKGRGLRRAPNRWDLGFL